VIETLDEKIKFNILITVQLTQSKTNYRRTSTTYNCVIFDKVSSHYATTDYTTNLLISMLFVRNGLYAEEHNHIGQ